MRKDTIEFLKSDKFKEYKKLKRRVDWGRFKGIHDFEDIERTLSYLAANIITLILVYEENSFIEVVVIMFLFLPINLVTSLLLYIPAFILIKVLSPIIDYIVLIINRLYREKVVLKFEQYKLANGLNAPDGHIYKDIVQFIDKDSIALQDIIQKSKDINEVNKAKRQFVRNYKCLKNTLYSGLYIKALKVFIDRKRLFFIYLEKCENEPKRQDQKGVNILFGNGNSKNKFNSDNNRKTPFGNKQSGFINENEERKKRSHNDFNDWGHVGKIPAKKERAGSIRPPNRFLGRKGIKTNWREVNKRKLEIGILGEKLVLQNLFNIEAGFNQSNTQFEHVSITKGDWLGYDIYLINEEIGEVYIEVKTTTGSFYDSLYMSENEVTTMKRYDKKYWMFRVYNFDPNSFSGDIELVQGAEEIKKMFEFIPNTYRVSVK